MHKLADSNWPSVTIFSPSHFFGIDSGQFEFEFEFISPLTAMLNTGTCPPIQWVLLEGKGNAICNLDTIRRW